MNAIQIFPKEKGEFSFIHRFFAPLAGKTAWNLGDDAGALPPLSAGNSFIVSVDNLAENVHFFSEDPPETIAQKLLRRNLSDMIAMGAEARGYFLSLAFNPQNIEIEKWFSAFQKGLEEDQKKYGLVLLGGDTTVITGGIFLSMTIIGEANSQKILRRNGAQPGDELWVTGTIGNAALGLAFRQGHLSDPENIFAPHYLVPNPPAGLLLGGIASAGLDISDGLLQDAGHLAKASQVAVSIDISKIPILPQAEQYFKNHPEIILEGGDDYQLLCTVNPQKSPLLQSLADSQGVRISKIGEILEGSGLILKNADENYQLQKGGWSHF